MKTWGFGGKALGVWHDISLTRTFDASYTNTSGIVYPLNAVFELYSGDLETPGEYVDFDIKDIQIERKSYATPFANGSRTGTVKDYSLNNNNATLQLSSTPRWVSDSVVGEGAYEFDGVNDYIDIGNNTINGTQELTVSAWVNHRTFAASGSSRPYVSDWNTWSVGSQKGFALRTYSNGKSPSFWLANGTNYYTVTSSKEISLNTWYLITGVFKANSIFKIYINGEQTGSASAPNQYVKEDATSIYIGKGNVNAGYFDGSIDDVRIYNRALTDAEIKHNYDIESYKMNK
jgi:hypothetical protein